MSSPKALARGGAIVVSVSCGSEVNELLLPVSTGLDHFFLALSVGFCRPITGHLAFICHLAFVVFYPDDKPS